MLQKLSLPQVVRDSDKPVETIAFVLGIALDAYRDGSLARQLAQRPGAARWLARTYLQPIVGTAGDALTGDDAIATGTAWLLGWAISQLRPDRAPTLALTDRNVWLTNQGWRPMLAVACHYGFLSVPEFRDQYYRNPDESPADNLCGLWSIGQSTFYRHLDRGKRLMARVLHEQRLDQRHTLSLRIFAQQQAFERARLAADPSAISSRETREARIEWHRRQAVAATRNEDWLSAVWHFHHAGDVASACQTIERHLAQLLARPELALLMEAMRADKLPIKDAVAVLLTDAAICRARSDAASEQRTLERALRLAVDSKDQLSAGVIYGQLGKHFEARDPERAFGYYQECAEFLRRAEADAGSGALDRVRDEYIGTLAKLAWLYTLRNDPRAKAVLDRAEALRADLPVEDAAAALLEQSWGEYWRRAVNPKRALEHQHRTLNIYQRLNDQQGLVKANINLGLTNIDLRQFDRAIDYLSQALAMGERAQIGAEAMSSAHLNLGACYFWLEDYDQAIRHYALALEFGITGHLALQQARAHHNLAEAFYVKFTQTRNAEHERAGDEHVAEAVTQYRAADNPAFADTALKIKQEVLSGTNLAINADKLLPAELAANYVELSEIEQHQATLAAPGQPEDHVRAHLAIAKAYLTISAKEREAAIRLIDKHGLREAFAAEFAGLRETYERELSREQKLSARWKQSAGDLLNDERRAAVLTHLIQHGTLNKSGYAQVCGLGPATASKHLAQLAEMGLLVQQGKGPSTKYVLAD